MNNKKYKRIQIIHLILGLFFTIVGVFNFDYADYLFGIWIISLGVLFLFDSFKEILKSKLNPNYLEVIHYIIAAFVLITGVAALSIKFNII